VTASRPPKIAGKHSGRARRGAIKVDEGQRSVGVNNRSGDREATTLADEIVKKGRRIAAAMLIVVNSNRRVRAGCGDRELMDKASLTIIIQRPWMDPDAVQKPSMADCSRG
jgi:hypothetical protein